MNRRQFLLGSTAIAAVACLPAQSPAAKSAYTIRRVDSFKIEKWQRQVDYLHQVHYPQKWEPLNTVRLGA